VKSYNQAIRYVSSRRDREFNGCKDVTETMEALISLVANLRVLCSFAERPKCQISTEYADLSSVINKKINSCRLKP